MSDTLKKIATGKDSNLLVGYDTVDDAAVYKISDSTAMISTIDFITPPVDDPYWFGQIAAANAISDVYAMGGAPILALNIVMFPSRILDTGVLIEILNGGNDKVVEAGAVLGGGHSVDDEEPKYGLSVNGIVPPDKILTNHGAMPGDAIILTKPLGTGVLFNAVRSGKLSFKHIEDDILPDIADLNRNAITTALPFDIHACTDVTGFGILGHLMEMAKGSHMHIRVEYDSLPFYPYALEMYKKGETTRSNRANRTMVEKYSFHLKLKLDNARQELLYDPQTSGGLLMAIPETRTDELVNALKKNGIYNSARIGEVLDGPEGLTVM